MKTAVSRGVHNILCVCGIQLNKLILIFFSKMFAIFLSSNFKKQARVYSILSTTYSIEAMLLNSLLLRVLRHRYEGALLIKDMRRKGVSLTEIVF